VSAILAFCGFAYPHVRLSKPASIWINSAINAGET
jgi:hypothetical protein